MGRVRGEWSSPIRNEQMKLENGRFQTSRRSCSPDCVGYLWVPLLWLLQVLKMPRERQESGKVSMSLNMFCWLLSGGHRDRGVMGWPSGVCPVLLEKREVKPGVLSPGQSLTSHKWGWKCAGVGLLWFLWRARRATLRNLLPSLLLLSIITNNNNNNNNKLQHSSTFRWQPPSSQSLVSLACFFSCLC